MGFSPCALCRRVREDVPQGLKPNLFSIQLHMEATEHAFQRDLEHVNFRNLRVGRAQSTLLLRGADVIELTGSGRVLGLLPAATFSDQTIALKVGDLFLLSTDGVTEAFNPAGDEFGGPRLVAAARDSAASAHSIPTAVMRAVTAFAENQFHDDASLLIVQIQP